MSVAYVYAEHYIFIIIVHFCLTIVKAGTEANGVVSVEIDDDKDGGFLSEKRRTRYRSLSQLSG